MGNKLSEKEKEEQKEMILSMCLCPECPSWVECGQSGGFCFETIGKSKCISEDKGCICLGCPAADKFGFEYMYYCMRGSAKEQAV